MLKGRNVCQLDLKFAFGGRGRGDPLARAARRINAE